jgi:hypothetical protein
MDDIIARSILRSHRQRSMRSISHLSLWRTLPELRTWGSDTRELWEAIKKILADAQEANERLLKAQRAQAKLMEAAQ